MIILVINSGSSSIKYQLLDMKNENVYDVVAKGIVEKIRLEASFLKHKAEGKEEYKLETPIPDHNVGIKLILDALTDKDHGVISSLEDIEAVGHRVVQGGEYFSGSAIVNEDVLNKVELCAEFAPLHNPANALGIRAIAKILPEVPQVVTFDSAFHHTMPNYAYMYSLPYKYYEDYRIRRYGAHGTSHQFVAHKGAEFAGIDINNSKIITCHIGSGSSITAIVNGKSIDTSMGFTPLEGFTMGTRCGNIDPNIVPYLMKKDNISPDEMTDIMNKQSGFLGVSGKTSDAREMDELANAGDPKAKLALKKMTYEIIKCIGSYVAAMNGVDFIVFTGGIGEHSSRLRRRVCENFAYLGLKLDYETNSEAWGVDAIITTEDSAVKAALITTDEELVIARDTMRLVTENEE